MTNNIYSIAQQDLLSEDEPQRLTLAKLDGLIEKHSHFSDKELIQHFEYIAAMFYGISHVVASRKLDGHAALNSFIKRTS